MLYLCGGKGGHLAKGFGSSPRFVYPLFFFNDSNSIGVLYLCLFCKPHILAVVAAAHVGAMENVGSEAVLASRDVRR